jgi:hypothetical protein
MSVELKPFSWDRMIEAVEAVRQRALRATAALSAAHIPYAVIGGNAVAAWVSRVDRAAVRNTQDVDILIRRTDFEAAKIALESQGFFYAKALEVDCFLDGPNSSPRDAVHIIFANEKVKPQDLELTADVSEIDRSEDYDILKLESLVRMKLTSFRRKDQVHLIDMISIGLIDATWPTRFQSQLATRLQTLLDDPNG